MDTQEIIQTIKSRTEKLHEINMQLKKDFVGIDSIIDQLTDNIRTWYIMPDLMSRPAIINLWGMTGVGKTDLIRKLVKYLSMSERFIEIQMDDGTTSSYSKIQHHIESIIENTNEPGILLIDEIQRFRTVAENGDERSLGSAFSDLWMLLSDGRFESDSKNRMEILDILYDDYMEKESKEVNEKEQNNNPEIDDTISAPKNNMRYKMWRWNARRFKKLLKLDEPVDEIMTWDIDKKIEITKNKLMDSTLFEGKMYSKLLIVISGNIDEAYQMSKNVEDVDFDADIFHEYSKKITILDIKQALKKRFKPEQIARFGNIHLIYPSLSKQNYKDIIKMKTNIVLNKFKEKHNININLDESVYNTIYTNGVFPTQGVRPVLSTISSILENSIPNFLLIAIEKNEKSIDIKTDGNIMIATIGSHIEKITIQTSIDNLRKNNSKDKIAMAAVHEAGHAVVYALRFKHAPSQLTCDTASSNVGGFMFPSSVVENKERLIWEIECDLAGSVAEEIMFSNSQVSTGSSADIMNATLRASSYVRNYSFDKFSGKYESMLSDKQSMFIQDLNETNKSIENIIQTCKLNANKIIMDNISFYKDIVKILYNEKSISSEDIIDIAKSHGIKLNNYTDIIYPNYSKMLEDKLNKC